MSILISDKTWLSCTYLKNAPFESSSSLMVLSWPLTVARIRWVIPPPPPPTWKRGGHSWIYDGIYGTGRRPTTGVWGDGEFPDQPPPPAAQSTAPAAGVVEEVVGPSGQPEEVIVPAAPAAAAAPLPAAQAAAPAPAPAPLPASVPAVPAAGQVENIVLPNGKQEEVIVPSPAGAPAAPPAAAPAVGGRSDRCGRRSTRVWIQTNRKQFYSLSGSVSLITHE